MRSLERVRAILAGAVSRRLKPIEVYDLVMHVSEAVLSGGVRRSATICLFSPDDDEMRLAKTGDWFKTNPQRAYSNNSAVLLRHGTTRDQFKALFKAAKEFGDPGFFWTDDIDYGANPCFTGDTLVVLADGSLAPIAALAANSEGQHKFGVLSASHKGDGNSAMQWCTEIQGAVAFRTGTKPTVTVSLSDGTGFTCTENHRLARPDGTYVPANQAAGCTLQPLHQGLYPLTVTSVIPTGKEEDVYDLTVADNHNFYVAAQGSDATPGAKVLVHNCVEIGLCPVVHVTEADVPDLAAYGIEAKPGDTLAGWQMCNLTTINGAKCTTADIFYEACRGAAYVGTLQAAYTNIPYLGPVTRYINDREALIGVSICGILDQPSVLLDPEVLRKGAEVVKVVNETVAQNIGIKPAARTTCVKPEGTASLLLGAASGVHPHHARRYFRRVIANRADPVYAHFKLYNAGMTEPSVFNPTRDDVITFPVAAPAGAITRDKLDAVDFLGIVRKVQHNWVIPGTRENPLHPGLHHNVSNTVNVRTDEWDAVEEEIWSNREAYTGVAMLAYMGDKEYPQPPFEEVVSPADVAKWNALSCSEVDYASMYEASDNTKLMQTSACAGGKCDLV